MTCVIQGQASSGSITISGLRTGGKMTPVMLNAVTWTLLPPSALAQRNAMGVQNQTAIEIKLNYDNTEPGYVGIIVAPGAERYYDITDSILVYAKSVSGTPTIMVEEIA